MRLGKYIEGLKNEKDEHFQEIGPVLGVMTRRKSRLSLSQGEQNIIDFFVEDLATKLRTGTVVTVTQELLPVATWINSLPTR